MCAINLIFVLTLGDVLTADLDPGSQKTLEEIRTVDSQQEGNALRFCVITHNNVAIFPPYLFAQ